VVDKVFALDDAPMAFERIKESLQFGKIVVKVS
jgi:NADPH:quinone reductase-like Zn-dependent oxidoreductase